MNTFGRGTKKPHRSTQGVGSFLTRFKAVMKAHGLTIWKRQKNQDFMVEHGFTAIDVKEAIQKLDYRNYHRGPEPDNDPDRPPGEVWIFYSERFGIELYMKLKLASPANSTHAAACLSFHEPEREMTTPLKVNGRGPSRPTMRKGRK